MYMPARKNRKNLFTPFHAEAGWTLRFLPLCRTTEVPVTETICKQSMRELKNFQARPLKALEGLRHWNIASLDIVNMSTFSP